MLGYGQFITIKLKPNYKGQPFIIIEDIVNNGTTISEVRELFEKEVGGEILAALCIVDRGGQTSESLGIKQYFPLMRVDMIQHDARNHACPLCLKGVPINTQLGKGKSWVNLFGQPPYARDTDFSALWKQRRPRDGFYNRPFFICFFVKMR